MLFTAYLLCRCVIERSDPAFQGIFYSYYQHCETQSGKSLDTNMVPPSK